MTGLELGGLASVFGLMAGVSGSFALWDCSNRVGF
jgi:hypothetical protein